MRPIEYLERLVFKLAVCIERVEYFTKGDVRGRDASLKRCMDAKDPKSSRMAIWSEISRLNLQMLNSFNTVDEWVLPDDVLTQFGCEMCREVTPNRQVRFNTPIISELYELIDSEEM